MLSTKDIILACTPFALVFGYFLLNLFSYLSARRKREEDPESTSEEFVRVNKVLFGVSAGALVGVIALYIVVIAAIKMNLFK